jgi:hypothetical protein
MQEMLIREFSKPTIAEIKKNKLMEYEARDLDVK